MSPINYVQMCASRINEDLRILANFREYIVDSFSKMNDYVHVAIHTNTYVVYLFNWNDLLELAPTTRWEILRHPTTCYLPNEPMLRVGRCKPSHECLNTKSG